MKTSNQDNVLRKALQSIDEEARNTIFADDFEQRLMNDERLRKKKPTFRLVAAVFLTFILLSAISIAAIHIISTTVSHPKEEKLAESNNALQHGKEELRPVSFENLTLDSILNIVALRYKCTPVFHDQQLRHLRLSTTWQPQQPLSAFIDVINELNGLSLTQQGDTIHVSRKAMQRKQ